MKRQDPVAARGPAYVALYPMMVQIARDYGYALAVHGSLHRDFDLVAIPWIEEAADPLTLFKALRQVTTEPAGGDSEEDDKHWPNGAVTEKPHGRRAYTLHFTNMGGFGAYIDLSVMPRCQTSTSPSP